MYIKFSFFLFFDTLTQFTLNYPSPSKSNLAPGSKAAWAFLNRFLQLLPRHLSNHFFTSFFMLR